MKVTFTPPERPLAPFVAVIWVFESDVGLPSADSRMIVPDGRAKILVPYRNSLCAAVNQRLMNALEQQIFLVGLQSNPAIIESTATTTNTIGVELTPQGLYHLFHLRMQDIANRMVSFDELFGAWGARLQTMVGDREDPQDKIGVLQTALTRLFATNEREYAPLDRALELLVQTHGMMRVADLASDMGYTQRYVDRLFQEHVGLAPKLLARILRFQQGYHLWMQQPAPPAYGDNRLGRLQSYYVDQSHFIHEFKRFTGYTPQRYRDIANEFGRAFETDGADSAQQ
ncbi:MAG TPA: AraC family transcriptional regulator [Ktedonobacterales bacterium]|nr:AraC family transcriptional regulator [Ktedonobacterales bacterium]